MAKRRERRVGPGPDRRKDPFAAAATTRADRAGDSASDRKLLTSFVLLCIVVIPALSVLFYYVKKSAPVSRTVSQAHLRGLVKTDVTYEEILTENSKVSENTSHRHYAYPVLAYITPWNSKGYEMAQRFNTKFTHLSPVWYDLKSQGNGLVLEGRHNADTGWISVLRMSGESLVVPRVVLEAFPKELLRKKKLRDKAIDLILTECKEMDYDGIVLESWSRWTAYGILHDPDMRKMALEFIKRLGRALHSVSSVRNSKQHLQLVYVIGPPHSEKLQAHDFGPQDLQSLSDAVDGFSLMTYDFSGPYNPGPNAPLQWIRLTLQLLLGNPSQGAQSVARKIFLGINFYGNDFILSEGEGGGGAITGRDYLNLLEKHRPAIQWERNSGEHFFYYSDDNHAQHGVFYPSLLSVSTRLEEARLRGTGISIWEIGQARFDGNSELVAELVTANGFKAAYAIKDGAEGPRGWLNSGLPWTAPKKALSLDLSGITETLSGAIGEGADGLSITLGVAAAAAIGLLAFSEIETILQVLGSAALVQIVSKKLLFDEDRKKTLRQVDEFLNTKVAPQDLADELKQIGSALLPSPVTSKALPAPSEASPETASADSTVQKAEAASELKVEAAAEPASQINSVPKPEVKAESLPGIPRPLSPYPYYPDFKPPTSPTPSQP